MDGATRRSAEHFDTEPAGQCHHDVNILGYCIQCCRAVKYAHSDGYRCDSSIWLHADAQSVAVASRRGLCNVDDFLQRWRPRYRLRMDGSGRNPEYFDAEPNGQCHCNIDILGHGFQRSWLCSACVRGCLSERASVGLRADG